MNSQSNRKSHRKGVTRTSRAQEPKIVGNGREQSRENFSTKASRAQEQKIYGKNACLSIWRNRPDDLIRVYVSHSLVKELSSCLRFCAKRKIAYHIVADEELARITESTHHEGVCFLVRKKEEISEIAFLETLVKRDKKSQDLILYLDGVSNPHNFGSIVRVAAHYGIKFIIGDAALPRLSGAATRVSQGGSENVEIVRATAPEAALKKLAELGYKILATSSHKGASLYKFTYPKKAVLVIGGEGDGMKKEIARLCDSTINIPGTEAVESLNVSLATGILLSEWWRQTGTLTTATHEKPIRKN